MQKAKDASGHEHGSDGKFTNIDGGKPRDEMPMVSLKRIRAENTEDDLRTKRRCAASDYGERCRSLGTIRRDWYKPVTGEKFSTELLCGEHADSHLCSPVMRTQTINSTGV